MDGCGGVGQVLRVQQGDHRISPSNVVALSSAIYSVVQSFVQGADGLWINRKITKPTISSYTLGNTQSYLLPRKL